jgi:hypothetical protein
MNRTVRTFIGSLALDNGDGVRSLHFGLRSLHVGLRSCYSLKIQKNTDV